MPIEVAVAIRLSKDGTVYICSGDGALLEGSIPIDAAVAIRLSKEGTEYTSSGDGALARVWTIAAAAAIWSLMSLASSNSKN
jgi:hypothetical protein